MRTDNLKPFDPSEAIKAFRGSCDPDDPDDELDAILASLAKCSQPVGYCNCGCGDPYFVHPESPDWKNGKGMSAYVGDDLWALDIMTDGRIGFIENIRFGREPGPGDTCFRVSFDDQGSTTIAFGEIDSDLKFKAN